MAKEYFSPATPYLKRLSRVLTVMVFLVGVLVITGWITRNELLKRLVPDAVAVNPLTAICFLLGSVSLWWRAEEEAKDASVNYSIRLGWLVAFVGMVKFISIIAGFTIYIDTLLFHDQLFDPLRNDLNRMAPNTAICFVLAGLSLAWLDKEVFRGRRPAQYFSILITFIALLSIYGYVYGVRFLYGIAHFIPMSLITAINFLFLSLAILFARPEKGTMAVIIGDTSVEVTLLRLAAFLVPLVMGWLKLKGEKLGYYNSEFGTALFAIATYSIAMFLLARRSVVNYRMRLVKVQAAEELKKAHHRFLQFFNLSPEVKAISNFQDGKMMYVNKAYEEFFGIKAEDAIGKTSLELKTISPEQRNELIHQIKESGMVRGLETKFRNALGEWRDIYIDTEIIELDGQQCLLSNLLDITLRKRAEEALRQKEQLLRSIVDNIGEGLAVMSPEGDYLVLNQVAREIIHQAPANIPVAEISSQFGMFYTDQVTPVPPEETSIARSFRGLDTNDFAYFMRNANIPEGKFLVSTGRPIRDENGKVIAAVTIFRDDTRRKQLEGLLFESEQKLREVMSAIGEGIVICNAAGKFILFNRKADEILGQGAMDIPPDQWPEKYHIYHPDGSRLFKVEELMIVRALKGEVLEDMEVLMKNGVSGTSKRLLVSARPVFGENNEIIGAVTNFKDITETRRLESLLNEIREKYNQLANKKNS